MDNEIIKAYLWQEVIRLGFSPSSERDGPGHLPHSPYSAKESLVRLELLP